MTVSLARKETTDKKEAGYALSSEFWANFAKTCWEKKPVVIKQPFSSLLATPQEVFNALVQSANQYRAGDRSFETRLYIEGLILAKSVGRHLPELADGSIEGYARRIARQFKERTFELIVGHLQAQDANLWLRLRDFFRPFYESIGSLAENPEAVVFLRNYKSTSRGIHQDTAGVFTFVIESAKRMIVWPAEAFSDQEDAVASLDSEPFLESAIILEGEPGDVIYWPSGYWHVGEATGGISLSINIGLELNYKPLALASSYLSQISAEQLCAPVGETTYPFNPNHLQEAAQSLPEAFRLTVQAFREASHSLELERSLQLSWLNRATGYGFLKVPPPLPFRRLDDRELVRGNANYPIVRIPWSEGRVAISANGHSFTVTDSESLEALVVHLNTGDIYRVKGLIEVCAGSRQSTEAERLRSVIDKLYSLRAVKNLLPDCTDSPA
jgi:hypothetical protein